MFIIPKIFIILVHYGCNFIHSLYVLVTNGLLALMHEYVCTYKDSINRFNFTIKCFNHIQKITLKIKFTYVNHNDLQRDLKIKFNVLNKVNVRTIAT